MGDKDESVQLDRLTGNTNTPAESESLRTSDSKTQLRNETERSEFPDPSPASPGAPASEEPKPFERDTTYAWLNFPILVMVYLDIILSLCVGISLIAYYSGLETIDTFPKTDHFLNANPNDSVSQYVYFLSDYRGPLKMGPLLEYMKNRDVVANYRRGLFYYGIALSMLAAILTPACIIQMSRLSKSCSYVWIYRFRPVLWLSLGMSIAVTTVTVAFLRMDYGGHKLLLLLILIPILILRFFLWILFVLYGVNVDYKDPRNKFWPYLTDHSNDDDFRCWCC